MMRSWHLESHYWVVSWIVSFATVVLQSAWRIKKAVKMSKESPATIVLWRTTTKFQLVNSQRGGNYFFWSDASVKDWCVPTRVICVTISVFYFVYFPSFSFLGTRVCVIADIWLVSLHCCSALIGGCGSSSGKWLHQGGGSGASPSSSSPNNHVPTSASLSFIYYYGVEMSLLNPFSPLSHYLASRTSWSCLLYFLFCDRSVCQIRARGIFCYVMLALAHPEVRPSLMLVIRVVN